MKNSATNFFIKFGTQPQVQSIHWRLWKDTHKNGSKWKIRATKNAKRFKNGEKLSSKRKKTV